jgi:hypothetical protein
MTKTYNLTRVNYGWYGLPRKAICHEFVEMILGEQPACIQLTVSTDELNNGIKIAVLKNGYYRWSWRCLDRLCSIYGMSLQAEEELSSIFPNASNECLDKEKILWISLTKIQT